MYRNIWYNCRIARRASWERLTVVSIELVLMYVRVQMSKTDCPIVGGQNPRRKTTENHTNNYSVQKRYKKGRKIANSFVILSCLTNHEHDKKQTKHKQFSWLIGSVKLKKTSDAPPSPLTTKTPNKTLTTARWRQSDQ